MRDAEVLVCFRPSGREAYVLPGTRLVEAAAEAGLVLEVPCGGEGLCGQCRVIVTSGAGEPTAAERHWLSAEELQAGWRLACQSAVCGPMEVEIPPVSRAAAEHKILVQPKAEARQVRFRQPTAPTPALVVAQSDLSRSARAANNTSSSRRRHAATTFPTCCGWSGRWTSGRWRSTCRCSATSGRLCGRPTSAARPCWPSRRLLDFEPGNTEADAFAVALDVGTTTLVGSAVGPGHGQPVGRRRPAESADPLRRRRPLTHPSRPAGGPTVCGSCTRRSPPPSTR